MNWVHLRDRSPAPCLLLFFLLLPSGASADPKPSWEQALDNDFYKLTLDVRVRAEFADIDGFQESEAYTIRSRVGIGSKPWHGLSAYAELEHSLAIDDNEYFDAVETPSGQSVVADPEETDLNQAYVKYENADFFDAQAAVGRQRIKLDDDRFVGNVGWRQNEQTYDAAQASTSFGIEHLTAQYGYIDDVRRIFGDDGSAAQADFDSDSHWVRLGYDRWAFAKVVLFAYLWDFDNSRVNSADTYGIRVTGDKELGGPWKVAYAGSYAFQQDAASNPVNYSAHYGAAEAALQHAEWGALGAGYELLGSDDGKAVFVTPLATAHKFNGFADAFLNNGGVNGLEDIYLFVAPVLPYELKGKIVYHHFGSDHRDRTLADEWDLVITRKFHEHWTVLAKGAFFNGTSNGPADRTRMWLELTFQY